MALNVEKCRFELDELEKEARSWSYPNPSGTSHWRDRMNTLIGEIDGQEGSLGIRLAYMEWSTTEARVTHLPGERFVTTQADQRLLAKAKETAVDIIKTLRWRLDRMPPATAPFTDDTVDRELWEHVKSLIEDGDWEKVTREAAVFVEDKLRVWASVPTTVTGSVNVFKDAISPAKFNLGKAGPTSEADGWKLLASGFALALRNPSNHAISARPDAKRYALGVLGLASLLLTQVRYEYGDPPHP